MVTIGLSIFFQAATKWIFGATTATYPQVFETRSVNLLGMQIETAYIMSFVISLFIMAGFYWFFKYSKLGLAMRATAFDQQVAQSLGISVKTVFAMSWAISALVSGVAGIVIGMVNGVSSALSVIGIKVFPAVILGGLDSIIGAIVGGVIIGLLENTAEFVDGQYLHWGNLFSIAPFRAAPLPLVVAAFYPHALLAGALARRGVPAPRQRRGGTRRPRATRSG